MSEPETEHRVYTVQIRDGGLWMSPDDWMSILAELATMGVDADKVSLGKGAISFRLRQAKSH